MILWFNQKKSTAHPHHILQLVSIDGELQNNRVCKKYVFILFFSKISLSNYRISTRHISLKIIAGAAGAKILKRNPPKYGFPVQKPCFRSVSEVFSTVKPCKIPQKISASGRIPKKPPLVFRSRKTRGGFFGRGGGLFRWKSTDRWAPDPAIER